MKLPSRFLPLLLLAATPLPSLGAPEEMRGQGVVPDAFASSNPSAPVRLGFDWYFTAQHEGLGQELWRTSGTEQGTWLVRDIAPGEASGLGRVFTTFELNGLLYFEASDGVDNGGLWRTDGTEQGTVLVHDLGGMSHPRAFNGLNGSVYFLAEGANLSVNLWRTDGTPQGTAFLRELHPGGKYGSFPPPPSVAPFVFQGALFTAAQGPEGLELWKTDGAGDVRLFRDFNPGAASSYPEQFMVGPERFFFVTGTSAGQRAHVLWVSDGTPDGTVRLQEFPAGAGSQLLLRELSEGVLYFHVRDAAGTGMAVWRSDGTPEGTGPVEMSAAREQSLGRSVRLGSLRLFVHETEEHGFELWRTDGTDTGTALVKDILPGPGDAMPRSLTLFNDRVYFSASDSHAGNELWSTDGTAEGTRRVVDLRSGPLGSDPEVFPSTGKLFFSADDGTGRHLYVSDGSPGSARLLRPYDPRHAPPFTEGNPGHCSVSGGGAALPVLAVVLGSLGLRRRRRASGWGG